MAEDEMYLGNLDAWVCEEKKTITYKWLSNELSVPSNVAKQMLHAFVEKKGTEVQPIYLLSGNREGYGHTITLVPKPKLAELKKQFDPIFSLHVYSVQAVLPKDSAHLWSVDNEQTKLLFVQPDNPIASNRWSALDYPEGKQRREVLKQEAAAPQQVAQAVKKETKVKVQPKDESSSQPSSPEKDKTTVAATKTGRLTTTTTTPVKGKKGMTTTATSSPTKKQAQGTRAMTAFFKKAPEEEKTQTLIANAKSGKGRSPSKKTNKGMDSFFAKKEKSDDHDAESEGGNDEEGDEGKAKEDIKKIKEEKRQEADGTDELDELLGGEATKAKPVRAKPTTTTKKAPEGKQKRKRTAVADADLDDDMDFESKTDTAWRQRLRKGKRKRNDDDGGEDEEEEEAKTKSRPVVKMEKEEEDAEKHGEEEEEEDGGKRKRRRIVKKQSEGEEEGEDAEPQPKKERKKRTTKAAAKAKPTTPTKRGRRAAAKEEEEGEEEEEEEGGAQRGGDEGENEEKGNEEKEEEEEEEEVKKKQKRTPKKEKPVERKEGVAKPTEFGYGQRRKKRVRRERTYVDDKGFEVTEDVWEEVSDDDTPAQAVALASIKDEPANNDNADASAAAVKKKGTTQGNIMSFFGKKK